MIKLFAIDLDGTLLDNNSKLSDENIRALKDLNDLGVKTVLASGRVLSSVDYFKALIGIDNPVIANNGAISLLGKDRPCREYFLDDRILNDLYDFAVAYELDFHFYDKDTLYTNRLDLGRISHLKTPTSYGLNYQVNLVINNKPIDSLLASGGSALKFQISNLDKHKLGKEEVLKLLEDKFKDKIFISSSSDKVLEIMDKKASKWQGIRDICDSLGISTNEVAAIGDSYNDIDMVENASLGFAMANANNTLKDKADIIVSDNESGGIVEAAEHILKVNKDA